MLYRKSFFPYVCNYLITIRNKSNYGDYNIHKYNCDISETNDANIELS